ncbi:hypothetical protein A9404_03070 [Halothiobacillus diazotrophicus]|uniref:Tetratricopeptide repeat-like domain-containing protein n=1 Tax=Halothiobacillus diazotrophicus TaxID=1860122 RepID=A0A191ZF57_9GAMM|nr:tetratricopeptide repeat protein [Halothiobacillus diazotrophicus]ANJ66495.1 hypothetical protein A9404_03070 [Halothiobacillus diazotrophicus]
MRAIPVFLVVGMVLSACSTLSQPRSDTAPQAKTGDASRMPPTVEQQKATPIAQLEKDPIYLIMAAELSGQSGHLDQAAEYYAKAASETDEIAILKRATQIALAAKRFDLAAESAARWSRLEPDSVKAAASLTIAEIQLGHMDAADAALSQWLKNDHTDTLSAALNELGSYLENNVPHDVAIAYTDHLATRFPDQADAQLVVAKLNLKFQRNQSAVVAARRAVALDPRRQSAHDVLIVALGQAKDLDGMIAALKSALKRYPKTERYLNGLIEAEINAGNTHQAGRLIEQALSRHTKDPVQLRNLALLSLQINRPALARRALQGLMRIPGQRDIANMLLGRLAAQSNELHGAIKYFNKIPPNSDHYAEARVLMSAAYAESGDLTAALQSLDIALNQPIDVADKQRLTLAKAGLLVSQGLDQEALSILTDGLTLWPDASDLQLQRAMLLIKLGQSDKAIEDLRHIIKNDPNNAAALNALGYTLADENRDLKEAYALIQKALTFDPDNSAYLDSLGWVQYRMGMLSDAKDNLEKAFKALPDAEVGTHLGIVLWHLNDTEAARKIWTRAIDLNPSLPSLIKTLRRYAPDLVPAAGAHP